MNAPIDIKILDDKKFEVKWSLPCTTRVVAKNKEEAIKKAEVLVWEMVNNTDMAFNRALVDIKEIIEE